MKKTRKQLKAAKLEAFEGLVSEYEKPLLRYAGRILRDPNAAQDVVQETFVRLFRRWTDPMEPSGKLSSWLYRVAHNCAVDYVRKESRRRLLHLRQGEGAEAFAMPDRGKGFRISEGAEKATVVLASLSLREQQLVILKIYEEKSYKEISEITGLTVSNVGYILHYAMKKMAAMLRTGEGHDTPTSKNPDKQE